ncbi:probable isoaspartyl peptidase/L-asparaginase CG7860 [Drosophila ficusphila]|uniref:probable isoaspartyl peptidase/L-asparaginase CG7860 n=1 Tax=Drosophila ficusphila TaxID=30025 RepID=UPI0007E6B6C8|nr:probable isoaspartyl peptidase/L-asparaginase CG7860 [Drosophila ficusphila]
MAQSALGIVNPLAAGYYQRQQRSHKGRQSIKQFPNSRRLQTARHQLLELSTTSSVRLIFVLRNISAMPRPVLLIHGGAGDISDSRVAGKFAGIKQALRSAWHKLNPEDGSPGSALDAVEEAVRSMELDENFNAGYGSCLNTSGEVEMEASLMEGRHLGAGCVTLLRDVMHPITAARQLMEKQRHTFIGGAAAQELALAGGQRLLPPGALITEGARFTLKEFQDQVAQGKDPFFARTELAEDKVKEPKTDPSGETVGAVAIDAEGHIVVATSTGGITGKWPGRIGDTPILGSGTYADDFRGGVSTTGHGETIMRYNLAQRILAAMEHLGLSAQAAADKECKEMTRRLGGTGGAIVVGKSGDLGISFTSHRMAWGYVQDGTIFYGIEGQVVHQEPFNVPS